ETTSATGLPGATVAPPTGFWLMTLPLATVVLLAVVTAPIVRPAPVIVDCAAACAEPTTLGTVTSAGPRDTVKFTAEPVAADEPAAGFWLMTVPAAEALFAVATVPTVRLAPVIVVCALACVSPT